MAGFHITKQADTFTLDLKCLNWVPVLGKDSVCLWTSGAVMEPARSSLAHRVRQGKKESAVKHALKNGQERLGISAVAICSSITTYLELGTM